MLELIEFGPSKNFSGKAPCDTPMVTVSRIGQVVFNKKAIDSFNFKHEEMILICQGVKDKKKWYFKKVTHGGFVLRIKKDGKNMLFVSKVITSKILLSLNTEKTTRFAIKPDLIDGCYWEIETN
jgi:hypothetical protein